MTWGQGSPLLSPLSPPVLGVLYPLSINILLNFAPLVCSPEHADVEMPTTLGPCKITTFLVKSLHLAAWNRERCYGFVTPAHLGAAWGQGFFLVHLGQRVVLGGSDTVGLHSRISEVLPSDVVCVAEWAEGVERETAGRWDGTEVERTEWPSLRGEMGQPRTGCDGVGT